MKRAPVNFELASSGHRRRGEFFVAPYLFYSSRPLTGDAHFLLTPPRNTGRNRSGPDAGRTFPYLQKSGTRKEKSQY